MIVLDNCPGFSSDELLLCLAVLLGERVLQVGRHAIGHPWTAAKLLSHLEENMKSPMHCIKCPIYTLEEETSRDIFNKS